MNRENVYLIKEVFEPNCFCYYTDIHCIGLKMTDNTLTGNEFSQYLSDAITHEHIHKVLDELFNSTVSKLFDAVEHHFRNHALHEKEIANRNSINEHINPHMTYQAYIKKYGFSKFLHYYDIAQEDVTQANIICDTK